jgi:hypothetical protein
MFNGKILKKNISQFLPVFVGQTKKSRFQFQKNTIDLPVSQKNPRWGRG